MKFPTLHHPSRYVWDFWYWYEAATRRFHLFYLNAPLEGVAAGAHHQAATVGYGLTTDFTDIDWGPHDVLAAQADGWDNTAIWTGDVVRGRDRFYLFYTSRDRNCDDGTTQAIGVATAQRIDARRWQRLPVQLRAAAPYEPRSLPGDSSIHAWRDPFLFRCSHHSYLLLSAKAAALPLGCKGAVAWLKAEGTQLRRWQPLPPLVAPGFYSEMEVPQLYRQGGGYALVFSSTAALDFNPQAPGVGGLHGFWLETLEAMPGELRVWLPAASGLYACRVVPELGGEIIGFDADTGGLRRSGVKTSLQNVDRDFSGCMLG